MNQKVAKVIRAAATQQIKAHGLRSGYYRWLKKQYLKIPRPLRHRVLSTMEGHI